MQVCYLLQWTSSRSNRRVQRLNQSSIVTEQLRLRWLCKNRNLISKLLRSLSSSSFEWEPVSRYISRHTDGLNLQDDNSIHGPDEVAANVVSSQEPCVQNAGLISGKVQISTV